MTRSPEFRRFALDGRDAIHPLLYRYQPQTSELTFTNLYIWRDHHASRWALLDEWPVVIGEDESGGTFALPPVGPRSRDAVVHRVLSWLSSAAEGEPRIERADQCRTTLRPLSYPPRPRTRRQWGHRQGESSPHLIRSPCHRALGCRCSLTALGARAWMALGPNGEVYVAESGRDRVARLPDRDGTEAPMASRS